MQYPEYWQFRKDKLKSSWESGVPMTTASREVLDDCRVVLEMLDDEKDEQRWRVLWAGAMALIRTVGHVLLKVDGEDPKIRPHVDAAWDRWKTDRVTNAIFWDFIEKERNNILKEYEFSVLDSSVAGLAPVEIDRHTGHAVAVEFGYLDENLFRPIERRFGKGEDSRDVYVEALRWWDAELLRIDEELVSAS